MENLYKKVITDPLGRKCRIAVKFATEAALYERLNILMDYDDTHYIYRDDLTLYYDYID
jgi:hypothetical protein